jgi:hypothetical protein
VKTNNIPAKLTPDVIEAVNRELKADFGLQLDLLPEPENPDDISVCHRIS